MQIKSMAMLSDSDSSFKMSNSEPLFFQRVQNSDGNNNQAKNLSRVSIVDALFVGIR